MAVFVAHEEQQIHNHKLLVDNYLNGEPLIGQRVVHACTRQWRGSKQCDM